MVTKNGGQLLGIATLRELSDDFQTINSNSKNCMQDALTCILTRCILLSYASYRSRGSDQLVNVLAQFRWVSFVAYSAGR